MVTVKSISRNHPCENRCLASEGGSSQSAAPLHCFGSDVPIVLISMQEKEESLMGLDRGCKPGGPVSPITSDECEELQQAKSRTSFARWALIFTFSYTKRKYYNRQKIRILDFDESLRFRPP
ncbi:hypothetical protein AVEN_217014-1 [Araneus ventricosus]|uniref:Uncharacterized protein n=1 Tax=Araneus ventricosus TaxID=182803 RepID=A0A4Y2SQJ7_ARAVE|nr:hypothetical protein AVEN_217014-1 [Araneus ventricosus]